MKIISWIPGRIVGTSNYFKLRIYSFWRMDCYLIKFPAGSCVGWHKDKILGFRHYRFNILLWGKNKFEYMGKPLFNFWRFILFRPDIVMHCVNAADKGRMYLSFGWKIRKKNERYRPKKPIS